MKDEIVTILKKRCPHCPGNRRRLFPSGVFHYVDHESIPCELTEDEVRLLVEAAK